LKSVLSILLIINCLVVVSLKDTLRSIHSLLHYIPNPFHTHHHHTHHSHYTHNDHAYHSTDEHVHGSGQYSSSHHPSSEVHHHYSQPSFDEKEVEVKDRDSLAHDHDVLDHFGLKDHKEDSATSGRKQREKKTFKFQWYPGVYYHYDFHPESSLSIAILSENTNLIVIYPQHPPSPPPEYILL